MTVERRACKQVRSKTKTIAPCTRNISRALINFQKITRNSDWVIAQFVPLVIGRSITLVLVKPRLR